ncbi:bifunctional CCR4-NOT transcription complex subunit 1/CCR4-Not complex component [Babesia duncani]|nr:bifunctional CCR4-NOT transcription complex subunit 1/CCR4-Not complex component [Babesia duncani]
MATCREPLRVAFNDSLREVLQTHRTHDSNDQVLVEQLVQILTQDNIGQSVTVCEKIIGERAQTEAESLAADLIKAIRTTQPDSGFTLPPALQSFNLKMQRKSKGNLHVYKGLFYSQPQVPSASLTTTATSAAPVAPIGSQASAGIISAFEELFSELKEPLREIALFPPALYSMQPHEPEYESIMFSTNALLVLYSLPVNHEVFQCITACIGLLETSPHKNGAAIAIAQRLLLFLSEGVGTHAGLNVEILLCVLDELNRLNPHVKQTLSNIVFSLPLEPSNGIFNVITITGLLRYHLLDWGHLTHYLSMAMDKGRNTFAVEMAIAVVAIALIDQRSAPPEYGATLIREIAGVACGSGICKTYPGVMLKDARAKLLKDFMELQHSGKPLVTSLTTILRKNRSVILTMSDLRSGNIGKISKLGIGGMRRVPPPPIVSESHKAIVAIIFSKWVECSTSYEGDSLLVAWRHFFRRFNLQSLFKMEGGSDNFFAICVVCAISTLNNDGSANEQGSITNGMDSLLALAKMADVMLRLVGPTDAVPTAALQKLLFAISCLIVHEDNIIGCYKLWVVLMDYFDKAETGTQVLCRNTFLHALQIVNPIRAPRFAKCWFTLLGAKSTLATCGNARCWPALSRLFWLGGLYVCTIATPGIVDAYTKLVLHVARAWPDYVIEHYWVFGINFVIERIALATHSIIRLPNIFRHHVKVDQLAEMRMVPKVSSKILHYCENYGLKILTEELLFAMHKSGQPSVVNAAFSTELMKVVDLLNKHADVQDPQLLLLLQSLVLNVGVGLTAKTSGTGNVWNDRLWAILHIMRRLGHYTKYLLIRAIARQLRFPNAHTHFYACLVLWMYDEFKADTDETNQHVILRVLLESFLAPYTCPWGVKLVVVEIFKNPRFEIRGNTLSTRTRTLLEAVAHVCAQATNC